MRIYKATHGWFIAMAMLVCVSYTNAEAQTLQQIKGRIAFSTDGNVPGTDDMAGLPLAIAMLKKTEQTNKIVYVDYANHYWNNTSGLTYNNYKTSIFQIIERYNIKADIVHDITRFKGGASRMLISEINKSTSANPLHIILNGPAAHVCDAVRQSNAAARRFVTVYTHGRANAETSVNGSCNMDDLKNVKPTTVNHVAYPAYGSLRTAYSNFAWLRDSTDRNINWIYPQLQKVDTSQAMVMDAGSVYTLLTGDSNPTPAKFSALFRTTPVQPQPEPQPSPGAQGELAQLLSDKCYGKIWSPAESAMDSDKWGYQRAAGTTHPESTGFDRRASYVASGPGGLSAVRFVSYGDKWNSLLDFKGSNAAPFMPAGGMNEARFVASYYIDKNYEMYVSGRFPIGFRIGDPNGRITCASGGCLPENQNGSSVRINFSKSLPLMIYSYHLNRTSPRVLWDSQLEGVADGWRQFGTGPRTPEPLPKGEWATIVLDVKINDIDQTNGSSRLLIYNAQGKLLTLAQLNGAVYRTDPKWKIVGPYMTEKYDDLSPGPKTQYMYARGFSVYNKKANCQ